MGDGAEWHLCSQLSGWSFFFDQNLLFFVMSCQGVERGAVDWNLSTAGSMNCSFVPCELSWPWTEFRTSWYKKGCRLHRQSLIESVRRGQLLKNHVQHVLGLFTQRSITRFKTAPSTVLSSISFHTASICICHALVTRSQTLIFTFSRMHILHKGELFSHCQTRSTHAKLCHLQESKVTATSYRQRATGQWHLLQSNDCSTFDCNSCPSLRISARISDLLSNSTLSEVHSRLEKQLTNQSLTGMIKNGDVIFLHS